jgi:deazaflavin-dependent oxidoreductase (nitroreductase family)
MPEQNQRPLGRKLQARAMRIINVPMRAVLGLPFPTPLGRRLMLAFIKGRKTGRVYRQPLSYARDGDVLLTPGGGNWKLNLRADQPVTLRIRGHDVHALPELVNDPEEIERLLNILNATNPRANAFMAIRKTPAGHYDPDSLHAAIEHGFTIVRWHPQTTTGLSRQ